MFLRYIHRYIASLPQGVKDKPQLEVFGDRAGIFADKDLEDNLGARQEFRRSKESRTREVVEQDVRKLAKLKGVDLGHAPEFEFVKG